MSEKMSVNLAGVKQSQGLGLWLVKVPKYLSYQWEKAVEKGEVGKLLIDKKQGRAEVSFKLNEELSTLSAREEKAESLKVPRDHPFIMQPVGGQTLAVYTQTEANYLHSEVARAVTDYINRRGAAR